ncbi:hypothetical protein SAMN04487764_1729 [Gillisia sp. Hel1_33_143]|uniref:hypothetical protein n=1 Tax=Gillisia sp. Hel1_33_143 TaxID=1336796 RepID=UPI00087CED58|nr:hypothetical protein [Gillisia sp. Hel1_33_143]SDS22246.1 hypothetical protein SAMN04487764_1729 [Gillisia sp. Hel1_33_143]
MAQDIREMFKNGSLAKERLEKGHHKRFERKLDKEFGKEKEHNSFLFFKVAAIFIIAIGVAFFYFNSKNTPTENKMVNTPDVEKTNSVQKKDNIQLSEISPEFEKIENYYLAGINLELAKLEINADNKLLIDSFMVELSELDKEYQRLNQDLNETGINEQTVQAMINNLQLRLELLFKLKNKLSDLKKSKSITYENAQI